MASPHADLEKLEKFYTTKGRKTCHCGSPMYCVDIHDDGTADYECMGRPKHLYPFLMDPNVLEAVEEIRYLRQLVEKLGEKLEVIRSAAGAASVHCRNYTPDLETVETEAIAALELLNE